VIQPQTTPVPAVSTVAWPPAGFVPAPLIPDRWSLQAPYGSDFSNATVSVTIDGVPQQIEILSNSGDDIGGQAIVWDMPNAPTPQPGQQQVYDVQVDNVIINGQSQNFSYTTTSFDPATTTVETPVLADVGFLQTSAMADPTAGSIAIDVACSINLNQPVSVDYTTVNGSALAGTNYVATSGVLTFQPGKAYSQIIVPLLSGTAEQPGGTFTVALSSPSDATVGPISSAQVTVSPIRLVVSQPVGDAVAGEPVDLQFSAEDIYGDLESTFDGAMTFELTGTSEEYSGGGTFVNGVVDFGSITFDSPGTYSATVTSGTITTTTPDANFTSTGHGGIITGRNDRDR
jgi:hypothetical protein